MKQSLKVSEQINCWTRLNMTTELLEGNQHRCVSQTPRIRPQTSNKHLRDVEDQARCTELSTCVGAWRRKQVSRRYMRSTCLFLERQSTDVNRKQGGAPIYSGGENIRPPCNDRREFLLRSKKQIQYEHSVSVELVDRSQSWFLIQMFIHIR